MWARSARGWVVVALIAGLCTGIWLGSGLSGDAARSRRWIGRLCWIVLIALALLWTYLAVTFGVLLAWTIPGWVFLPLGLLLCGVAVTALRPRDRGYVPIILPTGIWITMVLSGWLNEENQLRCDDALSLRPPVQLVVASSPHLASCTPGEVRPTGRYPRTLWESPDGKRVIFTTQGTVEPGGLDGSVCETRLDGAAPRCVGPSSGKSHGLIDLPAEGRLLAIHWGGRRTAAGELGSTVLELPLDQGIAVLVEHRFDEPFAQGFYEPRNSTLYLFSDRFDGIHRVLWPSFEPAPTLPPEWLTPDELHYDPATGEGVACGHHVGVAIHGAPFAARYLAGVDALPLEQLAVTWGCDWDEQARKVYTTVPNLGLLDKIDYDTGRVEQRWWIGPGMRSVAYDAARRRVYFTDFLRGNVLAFDEVAGRILTHWFVGRFSRCVHLTHDGRALLATSNLGIVRIPLDD